MQKLKILNKKEIKKILDIIKKQWGCEIELPYAFLLSEKNKIYIINKDISKIDTKKLKIDSLGMYFGELKAAQLRLSIEGSQLIGKNAKKNIIELHPNIAKLWMRGYDIEYKGNCKGFAIIKSKNNFLGTGKVKENKILNHVPKARRIKSED